MVVNIAAGRTFSISCPGDLSCDGQVECAGPNVEVIDVACVPTTRFATSDSLTSLRDQLAALS